MLIDEDDVVRQREEPVREAFRHVDLLVVVFGKVEALPLSVGRRALANIDDHVPYSPAHGLRELRHLGIVVQAVDDVL